VRQRSGSWPISIGSRNQRLRLNGGAGAWFRILQALRARLCEVLAQQSAQFEKVVRLLRPGEEDGAADFGACLLAAWHGALLGMKVERNATALDRFRRMLARLLD
jgi:hypothetical protein